MANTSRWFGRAVRRRQVAAVLLVAGVVAGSTAGSIAPAAGNEPVNELETRFVLPDGAAGDRFGESVAIDGDVAVIGAWGDDGRGSVAGAAVIVEVDDRGGWSRATRIEAADARPLDRFGRSVAVDGDLVVVGADNDRTDGVAGGSVHVFERSGAGTWVHRARLTAPTVVAGAGFGRSVGVDGDRIVVGARNVVFVFDRFGVGEWRRSDSLRIPDEDFGFAVAVDAGRIAVGAPAADRPAPSTGAAYVFEPDDAGGWIGSELAATGGGANARFGFDVDLSGDVLVAGVGGSGNEAFVFRGPPWRQVDVLHSVTGNDGVLGSSVAIDGARIIVGDRECTPECRGPGSVQVFEPDGADWSGVLIEPTDGVPGDRFGQAVGIAGDRLIVGAGGADQKILDTGAAYLYEAGPPCLGRSSWIVGRGPIVGTAGPDVITGSGADDEIDGRGGADRICGSGGDDSLIGGAGDDLLRGDTGADDIRGGSGIDTVSYAVSPRRVVVSLNLSADDGTAGEGDRVDPSVENIIGSAFGDRLIGNDLDNLLRGGAGDDVIQSRGGDDDLYGGPGDDVLRASDGTDELFGGPGDDELRGAAGNDYLVGGPGDDQLLGWGGTDICKGSGGVDTYVQCEAVLP